MCPVWPDSWNGLQDPARKAVAVDDVGFLDRGSGSGCEL